MKRPILISFLLVAGCANLTPAQQENLQLQLKVGETYLKAAQNLYCILEPTAGQLVAIYDTSDNTRIAIAKANAAQKLLCASVVPS